MSNHYGGTLGIENFFPDCVECGAAGDLFVDRDFSNLPSPAWRCHGCGARFDAPETSFWSRLEDLSEFERDVYLGCEVRGLDPAEYATHHGRLEKVVGSTLTKARTKVESFVVEVDDADASAVGD
jgi:hypothetical protein